MKQQTPVLWAIAYMGEFNDNDVYASAEKAQDAMEIRNERYPQGAAHRRVAPLYAEPITKEDA